MGVNKVTIQGELALLHLSSSSLPHIPLINVSEINNPNLPTATSVSAAASRSPALNISTSTWNDQSLHADCSYSYFSVNFLSASTSLRAGGLGKAMERGGQGRGGRSSTVKRLEDGDAFE